MLLEREILKDISKWIPREETIILTGPRQSGKTSLLKIIEKKLKEQEKPVIFFNLEDEEILGYLNQKPSNLLKLVPPEKDQKVNVILDEVQYLEHPTNFLKLIYDEYRDKIKLIVSGSSAFYIDAKFKDSLAGRKKIFYILPLNFVDFLTFKGAEELSPAIDHVVSLPLKDDGAPHSSPLNILRQRDLEHLTDEYMLFGGYPKIVLENDISIKIELLGEILNSYVKKDVIEADIRTPERFFALFKMLASQVGALVNEHELSSMLGVSTTAVRNYLYVMRKSFHIHLVKPFYKNIRKEITRMPKVFLFDTGLRNKILNNFDPIDLRPDKGDIFENFVFKMLADRYDHDTLKFWRSQSKNEVDFILESEKKAVEVKYNSSLFRTKKYAFFLSKYPDFSLHLVYHKGKPVSEGSNVPGHKI
jgi:predicted AAA+ superfamily ATPase